MNAKQQSDDDNDNVMTTTMMRCCWYDDNNDDNDLHDVDEVVDEQIAPRVVVEDSEVALTWLDAVRTALRDLALDDHPVNDVSAHELEQHNRCPGDSHVKSSQYTLILPDAAMQLTAN